MGWGEHPPDTLQVARLLDHHRDIRRWHVRWPLVFQRSSLPKQEALAVVGSTPGNALETRNLDFRID